MATTFQSDYYPPIVDTYLPAFLVKDDGTFEVKIYFSLSPYTDTMHNHFMQVKVADQRTNQGIINTASKLKVFDVYEDKTRPGEDKYYITLSNEDFISGSFIPFRYYKVQLRSINKKINDPNASLSYISNNSSIIYSEWSTVCLIKGITKPTIALKYFKEVEKEQGSTSIENITIITSNTVVIQGLMSFNGENGEKFSENIKSYTVEIQNANNEILYKSDTIYPSATDLRQINYVVPYEFEPNGGKKILIINVETTGYYTFSSTYWFFVKNSSSDENYFDLNRTYIKQNKNEGTFLIHTVQNSQNATQDTVLYIRRTDSNSNFKTWEDVYSVVVKAYESSASVESMPQSINWKDVTIESGTWYKYAIQWISPSTNIRTQNYIITKEYIDTFSNESMLSHSLIEPLGIPEDSVQNRQNHNYSDEKEFDGKIMMIFEDCYLVGKNGQQLKITFDNSLDSLKYSQYISKTDTIGSKYPFIRQNTATQYRTFTIGGIITFLSDESSLFITNTDLYKSEEIFNLYKNFNDKNDITLYNDYIRERKFREEVMKFLIADDVKLYRSTTEGNILIKLMDVSFNPKTELGRYIYSFSATAVECEEATISNYGKYKIQRRSDIGYDLLSTNYLPSHKIEIETREAKNMFATGLITVNDSPRNIKTDIDGMFSATLEEDNKTYNLQDITPYKMTFSFVSPPIDISQDSQSPYYGWRITVDNEPFVINASNSNIMNFESKTPMEIENIIVEAGTQVNVEISADIIYQRTIDFKKDANGNWIEIDPESPDDPYPVYAAMQQARMVEVTSEDFIPPEEYFNTNLVDVAERKLSIQEDINNYVLEAGSFSVYKLLIQNCEKGVVVKAKYDDSPNIDSFEYFIINQSLNANLDNNTADNMNYYTSIYALGFLVGPPNSNLTSINKNDSRIRGNKFIEDNIEYDIIFYTDLTFDSPSDNGNYGIIYNYFPSQAPQIILWGKAIIHEKEEP